LLPPRRTAHLVDPAKELNICLIAGMLEAGGERHFNTAVLAAAPDPPHDHPRILVAERVRLS
jgi:hypothetical protein